MVYVNQDNVIVRLPAAEDNEITFIITQIDLYTLLIAVKRDGEEVPLERIPDGLEIKFEKFVLNHLSAGCARICWHDFQREISK